MSQALADGPLLPNGSRLGL